MNNFTNNLLRNKKYLAIGIAAVFILIVVRIGIYFARNDFIGISPLAIALLFGGLICAFIFVSCICAWVYRDSVSRGEDGLLWALIVLITTPFIGLIVYFISRKEERCNCRHCGKRINRKANYCEHCGAKNEEEYIMTKTNKGINLIIAGVMAAVLMIGCFTTFGVLAFTTDSFIDKTLWNTGIISMSYENKLGNDWNLTFKSASDGYRKHDTLNINQDTQILYAEIECGEGELLLHIKQGDKQDTVNVSNLSQPLEYSLQDFEAGKITVILEINGAQNVKSYITVK